MTDLDLSCARIAVIGSGTMGIGIAQLAIVNGHSTVLYDLDAQKVQQAVHGLGRTFKKLVEKSKLTQQQADEALARLTVVNQIEALRDADLVIEAVVEKKKLNSLYLKSSLKFVVHKPFCKQYLFNFSDCHFGGYCSP